MDRNVVAKDPKIPVFPKRPLSKPNIPVIFHSSLASLDERREAVLVSTSAASRRSMPQNGKDSKIKSIQPVSTAKIDKHNAAVKPSTSVSNTTHACKSSSNANIPSTTNHSKVRNRRSKRRAACKVVEVKDFEAPLPQPVIEGHLPWNLEKKLESCMRISDVETERSKSASYVSKTSATVELTQPRFNSSLKLMRDLQSLKQYEIDGDALIQSKLKSDPKLKESLQHVEATATTLPPKQIVFKGLTSLELDKERLVAEQEENLQKLAAKIAPNTKARDPEPNLSDFFTPYDFPSEMPLPACEDLWKEYSFAQMVRPKDPAFEDGRAVYSVVTKNALL